MDLSITISAPGSKFAPIVLRGDYAEQMRVASHVGFKAIELHLPDPNKINQDVIFYTLEHTGLRVSTIGTGQAYVDERLSFSNPSVEIRDKAVQRIKDQIDFAKKLEAKVIIGTIKGVMPENLEERLRARNWAIDALRECSLYAEDKGTILTLEAVNRYETNFLNTAAETAALIAEVGSPALRLHLDSFHMNIEETSITETIKTYGQLLTHVHLADSNRFPPGMGHMNFPAIITALKEVGYQGYLAIECLPQPSSLSAAQQAYEYLSPLVA
jgi:sugar phosphate isomerase/epimerase